MASTPRLPLKAEDFRTLPEPVSLDDTVSSEDTLVMDPQPDDHWRETQWLLRQAGGF